MALKHILTACIALSVLVSCDKDETQAIYKPGTTPALSASATELVLTQANAAQNATTFAISPMSFGFDAAATYTLQIARSGKNFEGAKEIVLPADLDTTFSVENFNQMAIFAELDPETAGDMEARVKISVIGLDPVYSNVVALKVTPYTVIINYPSLWVPGNYQNWSPDVAPKIVSKQDNGAYEGFVYINNPSPMFKFTSHPNWDNTNYGVVSSTVDGEKVSGTISSSGGDIALPKGGYYRLRANTNDLTFEALHTSWGLIGGAIPGTGWDSDRDMTYDEATGTWSITLDLNADKIKFRANDGWDVNFGDDGNNKSLEYGGADIPVAEAGNYTITLDLHVPGTYTYKVKKN